MNLHDVNIKVPSAEEQSNTIVVTGAPANVENAKADLHDRVKDLEAEKADKELKSFDIQLDIKPEYHPKIIGRKGAVITKLRMDYRVNIQLPKKDDPEASIITITGYEKDANEAKIAIQKIVGDFVSFFLPLFIKVHIFWEGHKVLRNLHLTFDYMYWDCRGTRYSVMKFLHDFLPNLMISWFSDL